MKLSSKESKLSLAAHFRNTKPIRRADIVILAIILSLAILAAVFAYTAKPQGESAEIYLDGKLVGTYSLAQQKTVDFDIGISIHIDEGKIAVIKSTCPDKICVYSGYISRSGERIVCAPNKFVVVIRGESNEYYTGRKPI